ncbi:MAG: TetR/AcrR family transcriptional regulator [Ruminococcaceae bacterium]|nr:TetR/AcrR family transcriptional regulator [Oscillospiraceae bacterium]
MKRDIQKLTDIKEKIIESTITLIKGSDGLVENITMRDIAHEAGVAVGLINYHFESKKNLIEICVQRMISHVMKTFSKAYSSSDKKDGAEGNNEDMASFTTRVFSFLINNPEICKISMLADLSQPSIESNSSVSYRAILRAISEKESGNTGRIKAFMLLSTIQSAFLNRGVGSELFGINLSLEEEYYQFFRVVTDILNI